MRAKAFWLWMLSWFSARMRYRETRASSWSLTATLRTTSSTKTGLYGLHRVVPLVRTLKQGVNRRGRGSPGHLDEVLDPGELGLAVLGPPAAPDLYGHVAPMVVRPCSRLCLAAGAEGRNGDLHVEHEVLQAPLAYPTNELSQSIRACGPAHRSARLDHRSGAGPKA